MYPENRVGKRKLSEVGQLLIADLEGGDFGLKLVRISDPKEKKKKEKGRKNKKKIKENRMVSQKEGNGKLPHGFCALG